MAFLSTGGDGGGIVDQALAAVVGHDRADVDDRTAVEMVDPGLEHVEAGENVGTERLSSLLASATRPFSGLLAG